MFAHSSGYDGCSFVQIHLRFCQCVQIQFKGPSREKVDIKEQVKQCEAQKLLFLSGQYRINNKLSAVTFRVRSTGI